MSYDIRPKLICTQNLLTQATITGFNYLNPVALEQITWKYYIVICILILLELVIVYFTYPETSKVTLEEVSIIFDGKHAVHNALTDKQDGDETVDEVKDGVAERHEVVEA